MTPAMALGPYALLAFAAVVSMFARIPSQTRGPSLAAISFLLAAVMVGSAMPGPGLDSGAMMLSDLWLADRLSEAGTLTLLLAAAAVATLVPADRLDPRTEPLLVFGVLGGAVALHAADLLVLWIGLEISALAGLGMLLCAEPTSWRDRLDRVFVPFAVASALSVLALAMLYAGLSTTRFDGLAGRTSTVFTHWGAVQRYVALLAESGEVPPGLAAQARAKVIEGLAPAAMFLPGMLLMSAVLLARSGVVPFPSASRAFLQHAPRHVGAYHVLLGPLIAMLVVLRFYVGAWHAPRLVSEPYGWTGSLPWLGLLTICVGAVQLLRTRDPWWIVLRAGTVVVGEIVILIVSAALLHGLGRRLEVQGVDAADMANWARGMGDDAGAAALFALMVLVFATAGAALSVVAVTGQGDRAAVELQGLARRRPAAAAALLICLGAMAGAPLTAGFPMQVLALRSVSLRPELAWMVGIVVLGLSTIVIATVRLAWVMLSTPPATPAAVPASRSRMLVGIAIAAAACCVIGGVWPDPVLRFARRHTAGITMPLGSDARADWVRR